MPKRTDIDTILIIGAGPIVIGQACEFDYSGTQACKALREEGYRVVLINSNPATIMTDPEMADATYIEPITPAAVRALIKKEQAQNPDHHLVILPTMGGQTALNTALALEKDGTLAELGIEMIGATADAIDKAEDRQRFRDAMMRIGLECPRSEMVGSVDDALKALDHVGLPAIIRPSFTLGGTGGGIAYNRKEFIAIVSGGLTASPVGTVLVEESVLGWKEYEMEVVRDKDDNCIIICSIENIDPMGIHTGDSITVAPALTLTDKEYQIMRNAAMAVLREIGVETGGSNVQFAVNPDTGRLIIIEMNPRVSRSSALASKATGFPIAKIATKLAIGYRLDELDNDITKVTPASFEPTLDYIVTKIPRFTFEKFAGAEPVLGTAMKSVGEVMAIGRCFTESLQKALRSLETGLTGLDAVAIAGVSTDKDLAALQADEKEANFAAIKRALSRREPDRILKIAQAFRYGMDEETIYAACQIDRWFLRQIQTIVQTEAEILQNGLPKTTIEMMRLKKIGFSDARLASLAQKFSSQNDARSQPSPSALGNETKVAHLRRALGVRPVYKRIDTCAGEFQSVTPYMYGCYEGNGITPAQCEAGVSDAKKVIILGGGPNRIGQGIEFDYCCVHAAYALSERGYETIMVNCNPETVSTDYDTSDRLYFEPLTAEDVIEVISKEQQNGMLAGVIVQFGGQTPLKLVSALSAADIPILGTSPDAIDLAEDRDRFQKLLQNLNLQQPPNGIATSETAAMEIAHAVSYPVIIRPSYVLGGRAMEIVYTDQQLQHYMSQAVAVSGQSPVLIDSYLKEAIEVDVDALADGETVYVAGVMEHIEEAGIHSGDSACCLPPHSLSEKMVAEICAQTEKLALGLKVVGLMNVQFAIQGDKVFVLEVNPRASRTVPFVAKATGFPLAKIAARVMAGEKLHQFDLNPRYKTHHIAVKEAVFPFARFPGVDTVLGPEMRSTGEVMGLDMDFPRAFAKAQQAAGVNLPQAGTVFVSVKNTDKNALILKAIRLLQQDGFAILATTGTQAYLEDNGLAVTRIHKVMEGQPHIVDAMINGDVDLVINTSHGGEAVKDSASIRQTALERAIPYCTTVAGAMAYAQAIHTLRNGKLDVRAVQNYFE